MERNLFLTPKDRAQLVRICRKRDRAVREAQQKATAAVNEARAELDAMLDRYDLPYQPIDVDQTTGEIYSKPEPPAPKAPVAPPAPSKGRGA